VCILLGVAAASVNMLESSEGKLTKGKIRRNENEKRRRNGRTTTDKTTRT